MLAKAHLQPVSSLQLWECCNPAVPAPRTAAGIAYQHVQVLNPLCRQTKAIRQAQFTTHLHCASSRLATTEEQSKDAKQQVAEPATPLHQYTTSANGNGSAHMFPLNAASVSPAKTSLPLPSAPAHSQSQQSGIEPGATQSAQQPVSQEGQKPDSWQRLTRLVYGFYKFTRPHTMLGTTVSILSMAVLALQGQAVGAAWMAATAEALVSALLMNIAIVGINQISDVEIDKTNKPYLPLAAGDFSMQTGIAIVVATAAVSMIVGVLSGSLALTATLGLSLLLGIVYSVELPFLRWKRSPVLAASCILAVRAIMVQMGFYLHVANAQAAGVASDASLATSASSAGQLLQQASSSLPPALLFTVGFMTLFSVVIALFKDIPDVAGDEKAGVRTFSVRLGQKSVFWACIWILTVAYAGAVLFSITSVPSGLRQIVSVLGHCVLAGLLWQGAKKLDLTDKKSYPTFYMFVWKLFYAEYLLIPLLQ